MYKQQAHKAGVIHLKGFCVCARFRLSALHIYIERINKERFWREYWRFKEGEKINTQWERERWRWRESLSRGTQIDGQSQQRSETERKECCEACQPEGWWDSIIGLQGQKIKSIHFISSSRKQDPVILSIPVHTESLHFPQKLTQNINSVSFFYVSNLYCVWVCVFVWTDLKRGYD